MTKDATIGRAGKGVRINAVHPGSRRHGERLSTTPRRALPIEESPRGAWKPPEDVVDPTLYLASDEPSFVTSRESILGGFLGPIGCLIPYLTE